MQIIIIIIFTILLYSQTTLFLFKAECKAKAQHNLYSSVTHAVTGLYIMYSDIYSTIFSSLKSVVTHTYVLCTYGVYVYMRIFKVISRDKQYSTQ